MFYLVKFKKKIDVSLERYIARYWIAKFTKSWAKTLWHKKWERLRVRAPSSSFAHTSKLYVKCPKYSILGLITGWLNLERSPFKESINLPIQGWKLHLWSRNTFRSFLNDFKTNPFVRVGENLKKCNNQIHL